MKSHSGLLTHSLKMAASKITVSCLPSVVLLAVIWSDLFFSGFVYRHTAAGQPEEGLYAHYDIGTELGKGSFATVMKAISRTTGQWFAVKMIHKDKIQRANENNGSNNSPTSNLSREISILEKLQHPNICSLKEVFYQDGDISTSIYFFNFRFPC